MTDAISAFLVDRQRIDGDASVSGAFGALVFHAILLCIVFVGASVRTGESSRHAL